MIPNHKGNTVVIRRDSDWFVDMTQLGKDIKKPWRKWKFNNKRVIEVFERLEQKPLTKVIATQIGSKKYKHTWVHLVLALRVLADFDHVLSYHIFRALSTVFTFRSRKILDRGSRIKTKNRIR